MQKKKQTRGHAGATTPMKIALDLICIQKYISLSLQNLKIGCKEGKSTKCLQ